MYPIYILKLNLEDFVALSVYNRLNLNDKYLIFITLKPKPKIREVVIVTHILARQPAV